MGTIRQELGYPDDTKEPALEPGRAATAQQLIANLAQIDQALFQSVLDSMAEQVGDLRVNYGKQINLLKLEGSRLLKQLATIAQLPVLYDRYTSGQLWVPVTYDRWATSAIDNVLEYERYMQRAIALDSVPTVPQPSMPSTGMIRSYY